MEVIFYGDTISGVLYVSVCKTCMLKKPIEADRMENLFAARLKDSHKVEVLQDCVFVV